MRRLRTVGLAGLVVLVATGGWVWTDYRAWLELGPGGVPYNFYGWLQVTRFRLDMHDPLDSSRFDARIGLPGDVATLENLPPRAGTRPRIDPHPIPHRQRDQFGTDATRQAQKAMFDRTVAGRPDVLMYRKSVFELRNDGVFLRDPAKANPTAKAESEVGHIHPSDGSMHMTLSPSDAKRVIALGWGELHGLSGAEGGRLPATYMMLYSPRNADELVATERILQAAVAFEVAVPR